MTVLTASPHIHGGNSTRVIMRDVLIALLPAAIFSIFLFSWAAVSVLFVAIVSCVAAEYVGNKLARKPITVQDLSAVVTAVLYAFCLPATTSWWAVMLGGFFAIGIVKILFGGIGCNIFNPALAARAFLLASYPIIMTTWTKPFDSVTMATPLGALKEHLPMMYTLKKDL